MTKGELVIGKHVVEFRDGRKGLRLGLGFIEESGKSSSHIDNLNEDLTSTIIKELDVVAVYTIPEEGIATLSLQKYMQHAKEIWRRNDNQEEYDKLMKKIDELKAQAEKIKAISR